jgi:nicotinic acetylcholine receptor, invertebrate
LTRIFVLNTRIWVPDILLYNSADDKFDVLSPINAVIHHNGRVDFIPPGMFKSMCPIDITDFPFDEQKCPLKFGSWTHHDSQIKLANKSDAAQMDAYIENGEWKIESVTSFTESVTYECCPENYPFVMFTVHIRRRTLYFLFNLIFPCVLISSMSILGFCLPPDSGEKIGLGNKIVTIGTVLFNRFLCFFFLF